MIKKDLLDNITIEKIKTFLESSSWNQLLTKEGSNQYCFESVKSSDYTETLDYGYRIFLPKKLSDDFIKSDRYYSFLDDILGNLADVYHQPKSVIIDMINDFKTGVDVIRLRINPNSPMDSIALSSLMSITKSITDIIIYSATSEMGYSSPEGPQRHYAKPFGEASKLGKTCRFGQTFYGSFGIKIYCNFSVNTQRTMFEELNSPEDRLKVPLPRRSVERILQGFNYVSKSEVAKSPEPIISNYVSGMNANMCEALEEIYLQKEMSEISMEVNFDKILKTCPNIDRVHQEKINLILTDDHFGILEKARKYLTPDLKKVKHTIVGYVTEMKAKDVTDLDVPRVVKIEAEPSEQHAGTPRAVTVKMRYDDYLKALDANSSHKKVSITGKTSFSGRKWNMEDDYSYFKIIND